MNAAPAQPGPSHGRRVPLLAREGWPFIAVTATLALVSLAMGWMVFGLIALVFTLFTVNFFRDPERTVPNDPQAIVSPADGRVIKVAAVREERFLQADTTLVSIFMSPLDVHVNRVPESGTVIGVHYHPGKYFRAFADKASLDNEQNAVVLDDAQGRRICFVQIAGFVARRIVCHLRAGMPVVRGQRFGMIMFGSRADIYLPPTVRVRVAVGDRTVGGETVIAEWT